MARRRQSPEVKGCLNHSRENRHARPQPVGQKCIDLKITCIRKCSQEQMNGCRWARRRAPSYYAYHCGTGRPFMSGTLQVFYDGACPLCRRQMNRYRRLDTCGKLEWVDTTRPGFRAEAFGLDPRRLQEAMHARFPDGRVVAGVTAFVAIWNALPPRWSTRTLQALLKFPGMMWIADLIYRLFARNRYRFTGRCTAESCDIAEIKLKRPRDVSS
jgi:predicted DCC family thiol-disulfide oxidoreductase YuxK